jgi:hypothetical protein
VRGTFHRVQVFSTMEAAHYSSTAAQAAAILKKRDATEERAQAHFSKFKERWIDLQMAKLLKAAPAPTFSPPGSASLRRVAIRKEAEMQVINRYMVRVTRINEAAERMIAYAQGARRNRDHGR